MTYWSSQSRPTSVFRQAGSDDGLASPASMRSRKSSQQPAGSTRPLPRSPVSRASAVAVHEAGPEGAVHFFTVVAFGHGEAMAAWFGRVSGASQGRVRP